MKILIVCLAVVAVAKATVLDFKKFEQEWKEWNSYKSTFNKLYDSPLEEEYRFRVFIENRDKINAHNERHRMGLETSTLKINKFADMTQQEFAKRMLSGYVPMNSTDKSEYVRFDHVKAPASYDWRQFGAVTGVKNQAQCGSCWSFSTTGAVEGQNFLATGQLVSLSEQNLMDCSTENGGCDGGNQILAYQYIIQNGGIDTEASYPYLEYQSTCEFNPANVGATISSYKRVTPNDEEELKNAVATVGPIAISIDASGDKFQHYSSGIYVNTQCRSGNYDLDHAVLIVGYGSENGYDYWLVKNSWGTDWGDQGYIKMLRNGGNQCGVATTPSYPIV